MTISRVSAEIDRHLETLDGELTSHSRAIDAFLDVRCASDDPQVAALVDHALGTIPGRNSAETEWVRNQLIYIGLMCEVSLVADTTTATA